MFHIFRQVLKLLLNNIFIYLYLDEELKFLMLKRRCVSIYGGYKVNNKAAHNHFQRYSDVKAKGNYTLFLFLIHDVRGYVGGGAIGGVLWPLC